MGEITGELGQPREVLLQARQHAVERLRQLLQFGRCAACTQSALQPAGGDLPGLIGQRAQRPQRAPHHVAAEQAAGRGGADDGDRQQMAEALQEIGVAVVIDGQQGDQLAAVGQGLAQVQGMHAATIGEDPVVPPWRGVDRLAACMLAQQCRCGREEHCAAPINNVEGDIRMVAQCVRQALPACGRRSVAGQVTDQRNLVLQFAEVLGHQVVAGADIDRHAQCGQHQRSHDGEQQRQPYRDGATQAHPLCNAPSSGASST